MPRRATDASLFVKFETRAIKNERKSYGEVVRDNDGKIIETYKGEGRLICDNVDYIHIEIPGDRNNIVERPVTSCDKDLLVPGVDLSKHQFCRARMGVDDKPMTEECDVHRFYEEYVAFRSGKEDVPEGTALKNWAGIDRASVEELAYRRIYTVEQLAGVSDSLIGGYLSLRERAREYLERAKSGEEAALRKRVADLEQRLAAKEGRKEAR